MKPLFSLTIALACLNAALVTIDMLRSARPLYAVSLTLTAVMLSIALVCWRTRRHLGAALALAGSDGSPLGQRLLGSIQALTRWLSLAALLVAMAMGGVLTGILSRMAEGYPLFG